MIPTPDREEALRLARTYIVGDGHLVLNNPGYYTPIFARALLAFAADLEAAEKKIERSLNWQEYDKALTARAEAAERERDRLKEYEEQWNELASVEFIDYWHSIGYSCTAGTAIKALLRDFATTREALERCPCLHDLAHAACAKTPGLSPELWCVRCAALRSLEEKA